MYTSVLQPRLIEVILDGEYEGNDVDAAIAVMREFDVRRTNRLHSRVVLQTQESFFRVIENDGLNFISHLNNNNSQVQSKLFMHLKRYTIDSCVLLTGLDFSV